MTELEERLLRENWLRVQEEVHQACVQARRDPDSVKIVGVTKYVDAHTTLCLARAGCTALGENRPQLLWQKHQHFAEQGATEDVQWHMIGHLQRNKIRRTLQCKPIIHSIDSERLLEAISKESAAQQFVTDVLLEVNISGDSDKTGMTKEQILQLIENHLDTGVRVRGLMAMAGWGTDVESARNHFEQTRELRDQLETRFGIALPELSMGMSGDFPAAIAAGATLVRIGSRLFQGILDRD
ncbi:MAG: YggS family pyridoxal phosphate-dependent enzyme [Rubripirellula sp.]